MKIIRELEDGPRGVYCGAIGWWRPGRKAQFSVAIRTAVVNRETKVASYPVGSGITWDSVDALEYLECQTKTAVLHYALPAFQLFSSLRLDDEGYFLLPCHLDRLERSAAYFDFPVDRQAVASALEAYRQNVAEMPAKVRIAIDVKGAITLSHAPLPAPAPWNVGLARVPMDTHQPWVYHKTTQRQCYDAARATRPDCNDVILINESGHLTEATFANIVVEMPDGKKLTPPQSDGLLDGVFRRHLLAEGIIEERQLTVDDLELADAIYLINSVRKWIPVSWRPAPLGAPQIA